MPTLLHDVGTTNVNKTHLDTAVDLLRQKTPANQVKLNQQACDAISMLVRGHHPKGIQGATGVSSEGLSEIVKGVAKRFRVRGRRAPVTIDDTKLFLEPSPEELSDMSPQKRGAVLRKSKESRRHASVPQEWVDEYPHEVGVKNAVAWIRRGTEPGEDLRTLTLGWRATAETPSSGFITYPLLQTVWNLVHSGQFVRVALSEDLSPKAAESIVNAYDALEAVRSEGELGLTRLLSQEHPETAAVDAMKARPIAEAAVQRLEAMLVSGEDDRNLRALSYFQRETGKAHIPQHVGELNEGQLNRIALALGVNTSVVPDKGLIAMEKKVAEAGLEKDIPWLKGLWVAAHSNGMEHKFWEAVDELVSGKADWVTHLR